MKYEIEFYILIFSILITNLLLFLLDLNLELIFLFILLDIALLAILYLYFRRKKTQQKILEQAEEILTGNLNRRILVEENNNTAEFAVVFNELTDKLQNQKIRNLKSEESRKRFLSNISHDIRTPLTSLLGYVEVLDSEEDIDEVKRKEYYNVLINKAKNLKNMIDEIFQMARIESNDYSFNFQTIDLAEILRNTIIDYLTGLENEDLNIDIEVPEKECKIYGDKYSVERIIGNIIKNSIEHGKAGGYIGVKLNNLEDGYNILITDKGPGISEDDLPFIFERLYENNKEKKNSYSQSGLGLAIAKKLLEIHKGEISIDSNPNQKTTFKLYFPQVS